MFNYFFDVLLPIKMMFSTMNNVYPLSDGIEEYEQYVEEMG